VAVASAGPYASLHLAPDRKTTPAPGVFKGQMPFLPPNQQCQGTELELQFLVRTDVVSRVLYVFCMNSMRARLHPFSRFLLHFSSILPVLISLLTLFNPVTLWHCFYLGISG